MPKVSVNMLAFQDTVKDLLADYQDSCVELVGDAVKEVTKEAVDKLKDSSASTFGGTGEYSKGWTSTIKQSRLTTTGIVHGRKTTSRLAHLLEFGHVSRNGTGRTFGQVPGREHIAPVDQWATEEAVKRVIQKLEGAK